MAKWEVKDGVATPADVTAALECVPKLLHDLKTKSAVGPGNTIVHMVMSDAATTIDALAAALAVQTRCTEAAEDLYAKALGRANEQEDRVAELTVENERLGELFDDLCYFPTPEGKASHLAKMVAQSQARVAELTAKLEAMTGALNEAQYGLSWALARDRDANPPYCEDPCPPVTRGLNTVRAALKTGGA